MKKALLIDSNLVAARHTAALLLKLGIAADVTANLFLAATAGEYDALLISSETINRWSDLADLPDAVPVIVFFRSQPSHALRPNKPNVVFCQENELSDLFLERVGP